MEKNILSSLHQLKKVFIQNLDDNLLGIYIHGSVAYECFNPKYSDIDLIIVVKEKVTKKQKIELLEDVLSLWDSFPKKGLEFSIVLKDNCLNLKYPVPYELHFSKDWLDIYTYNLDLIINDELKSDWDLVTYFRLIFSRGLVLYGEPIKNIFGYVPNYPYLKSICMDMKDSYKDLEKDSVSIVLNQCRILAFIYEEKILSKKEAGEWCIEKQIVSDMSGIVSNLKSYSTNETKKVSKEKNLFLYKELYKQIEKSISGSNEYKKILVEVL